MLFVRKPTIVVEDSASRIEGERVAEERGQATGMAVGLGVLALAVVVLLVGYFAWYAPVNAAQAQDQTPQVVHDTQVIERPGTQAPPTIINNPPVTQQPPTVIEREHERVVPVPVPTPPTTGTTGSNTTGSSSAGTDGSGNGSGGVGESGGGTGATGG